MIKQHLKYTSLASLILLLPMTYATAQVLDPALVPDPTDATTPLEIDAATGFGKPKEESILSKGKIVIDGEAKDVTPVADPDALRKLSEQVEGQAELITKSDEQITNQLDQIDKLDDQIDRLNDQIDLMESSLAAITGNKNISNLGDNNDRALPTAATMEGLIVAIINGGAVPGDISGRLQALSTSLKEKLDLQTLPELWASPEQADQLLARLGGTSIAAAITGEATYEYISQSTDNMTLFIEEIDRTGDLKASVDLNTRVLAEVARSIQGTILSQAALLTLEGQMRAAEISAGIWTVEASAIE